MRRWAIPGGVLLACCLCCGVRSRTSFHIPPASAGQWIQDGLATPDTVSAPEPLRGLHPEGWVQASYKNEVATIRVDVFSFKPGVAFEAAQRYHAGAIEDEFLHGDAFVVCSAESVSRATLLEFTRELEAAWPGNAK